MSKSDYQIENEKNSLIEFAEEKLSKSFFENIDRILSTNEEDEEEIFKYSLIINSKGAFYACEE